jgi:hypothetical protein
MRKIKFLLVLYAFVISSVLSAEKFSYVDLVKRMIDLESLAVLPVPGEVCAQWSSYDRASKYDEATGKYVEWGANGDGRGIIRKEGDSQVLAEIEGPGCIWRIWSAAPKEGHVRIYLDGATTPTVDLPFIGYFNCKNEPFVYPSLVYVSSSGHNCYIPIPFQKSCKIVADDGWGDYYHFTYSKFPKGTVVPTFKRQLSPEEKKALETVNEFLANKLGTDPSTCSLFDGRRNELRVVRKLSVAPGRTSVVAILTGQRAITSIKVKVDPSSVRDIAVALRSVALSIKWDGEKDPSVWVPLGDFFGSGPGINKYKTLPMGMTDEYFYSYWYMPFSRRALIELVNDGKETLPLEVVITHAPLTKPADQLGRFHAKWHRDALMHCVEGRWPDWPMLVTQGRGRYVGVMLEVWNPEGGWWGEGDEKFFVDGEKFPSTIGTGSEDYFGYAWCNPTLFQKAFHSQTRNDGDNRGHVSVNRWHIGENVPFQSSFEADIEKYFGNDRPTLYACTVYWYLAPGGVDPYGPVSVDDRFFYIKNK